LSFVPNDFDASSWENIEPYVNDLINRELSSSSCLEKLISDTSNLAEHISETGALLYIGMTCDTENENKKNEFLYFVENIRPKLSEFSDNLNRRIASHPSVGNLPERYDLMIRGIISDIEIFRSENIPLGVEQTKLVTKAQGITGAMTVEFQGQERTFPEMKAFLESNSRDEREKLGKKW
jgi:oligoendopeptidase F